jgi:SAM-dependent methyltransferase
VSFKSGGVLKIPPSAFKYILFQRTNYLSFWNTKIFGKPLPEILRLSLKDCIAIESLLCRSYIKRLFVQDILKEYQVLKNHLPKAAESILDIGCGVGGIDAFLNWHYNEVPHFYLLDKTKIEDVVYYDLHETAAFYNSLPITELLLFKNGIARERLHIHEARSDNRILFDTTFDLVISLFSWGFHYPVSTYLEQVDRLLKPGGILVIDVRKGSQGEMLVQDKLGNIRIIQEHPKSQRILARKLSSSAQLSGTQSCGAAGWAGTPPPAWPAAARAPRVAMRRQCRR